MTKTAITYIFVAISAVVSAANTRGAAHVEPQAIDDLLTERVLSFSCPAGQNEIVTFEVEAVIHPDTSASGCNDAQKEDVGELINDALLEVGIGGSQIDGDTTFVAQVCKNPYSSRRIRRTLTGGWTYNGGGACHFCGSDDDDGRRRQLGLFPSPNPTNVKFESSTAPLMEVELEDLIKTKLQKNVPCVGAVPSVEVTVTEKTLYQLAPSLGCADFDSSFVSTLMTFDTTLEVP